MLSEEQKQQILYPLSSSKSSFLRVSGSSSEKIVDWQQTKVIDWLWKMMKERQKTANTVPTVFEQKFGFKSFGLHFWENHWLTSNNNNQNDWKRCWVKWKNSKYCAHCLRTKVRFWDLRAPFLRKRLIDVKHYCSNWLEEMLSEEQKQQKLCPLSSSKTSLLRTSTYIFEKIIDWHQTMMFKQIEKDVEWRAKTAKTVLTVFEQKFAFESSRLHFWEYNWLTSNNKDQIDWKRCWVNSKNSKNCAHCLRTKVCFWDLQAPFLRKRLIDVKHYSSNWLEKMLSEEQEQQILCPLSSSKS